MFTLSIATENAAFEGRAVQEISRIMRDVAKRLASGETEGRVRDENGNTVGSFDLSRLPANWK